MKLQLKNITYRKVTSQCFICNKSRFGNVQSIPFMLLQCRDDESKCPISNLYNNQIFTL